MGVPASRCGRGCVLVRAEGALRILMNRYGSIRLARVPERVSTTSLVILSIGNSKSFHLGAQGTFDPAVIAPRLTRGSEELGL